MDEALEKGYFGRVPDDKPNSFYTVAGQAADMPAKQSVKKDDNA